MIRLAAPTFDEADRARIDEVLRSGMLVQGRYVAEFEALVSQWMGIGTLACSNGTAALHLALLALDLRAGDEVIVPAFTWPSTAHVIVQAGARPVFVDIDPETLNLDPDAMLAAITPQTRAILPVHLFGIPAPMTAVMQAAAPAGLAVIEDAACAIGTICDDGRLAGTIGTIGCFSLHPRKIITTGEGGLLTSRDPEILARLSRLRNHGMIATDGGIRFVDAGLNYRLTELGGALGIGQMGQLDFILQRRRALGRYYLEQLASLDAIRVPGGLGDAGNTFQSFVVDVDRPERRTTIMAKLAAAGIPTTIGTYSVTDQPIYRDLFGLRGEDFPSALHAARALMTLPLHQHMVESEVDQVVAALRNATTSMQTREGSQ